MFIYIDETGNSGANLFDKEQPLFLASALMSRCDIHAVYRADVRKIANRVGAVELHGGPLGLGRIDIIAREIVSLLKKIKPWFGVAHIDKKYLALSKMFDYIFDSGENLGVPWHVYNVPALRLLLLLKLGYIVDDEMKKQFWFDCLLEKNKDKAIEKYVDLMNKILSYVHKIPDVRSRELIGDACRWAANYPDKITLCGYCLASANLA